MENGSDELTLYFYIFSPTTYFVLFFLFYLSPPLSFRGKAHAIQLPRHSL